MSGRLATWLPASQRTDLAGDVHIWRWALDLPAEDCQRLERALDATERERANRFRTEELRHRFVAGRGSLRAILGEYLGVEARSVAFRYGPHGKPALAEESRGLAFNLAHSSSLALCVVARDRVVGVDVEWMRPLEDAARIIRRYFSAREQAEFLAVAEHDRLGAFYRGWTRKEAFLKATGTGLATELDSFDVTLGRDEPARLLRVGADPAAALRWSLHDIDAGPSFAAAVAVSGPVGVEGIRLWDASAGVTRIAGPRSG